MTVQKFLHELSVSGLQSIKKKNIFQFFIITKSIETEFNFVKVSENKKQSENMIKLL